MTKEEKENQTTKKLLGVCKEMKEQLDRSYEENTESSSTGTFPDGKEVGD